MANKIKPLKITSSSAKYFIEFGSLSHFRSKSKIFTSRLADQRARLVVMSRRGDLPEELENEKIVELQLQKKKV